MFNRLNSNNNIETNRNHSTKEKVASTIAAVALACGCAVGLSGCNDKNSNVAKSPEPSVSETTTTDSENIFDSDAGDAGLNLKTVHSDALEMDITIPESAELISSRSDDIPDYFDDGTGGKGAGEAYIWEKDGIYYQYEISRYIFEKCPEKLLDMYNTAMDEHEKDSDGTESMVIDDNIVASYSSDWSAGAVRKFDNDCTAYASVVASKKLNERLLKELNRKTIDMRYYYDNGIDESEKQQIRPILGTMMNKTIESLKAIN